MATYISRRHYVNYAEYAALEDVALSISRTLPPNDEIRKRIRQIIGNDVLHTYENYSVLYELVRDAKGTLGEYETF